MIESSSTDKSSADDSAPPETEAGKNGGVEAAKHQAEKDWQDSAKEDGE